jgi:hypothetical protein
MTVSELDLRMSSSELTEWMAYERITGPLGRRRQDIQAATISATIANANRGKGGRRAEVKDFLIVYGGQKPSPSDMLAMVKEMNAALGGEYVGGPDS